jgi:DNA repair protein RadD
MFELRKYQRAGTDKCLEYLGSSYDKGVCASFATAAGKSLVIAQTALEWGEPAICLQPSKELLEQNLQKAKDLGIENLGVYSASLGMKELSGNLTYATLGSVKGEAKALKKMGVSTLYIDECHYKFSEKSGGEFKEFLKILQPKKIIGFTATPFKLQQSMLGSKLTMLNKLKGKFIHDIIHVTQNHEMVSGSWWTPIEYEVHEFDESGLILNTTGSEFTEDSVKAALHAQGVNNNTYLRIKKLRRDGVKSILVFVESVEVAEKMASHVENSAALSAKTSSKERTRIVKEFKSGELNVLINVGILTTGFDYPDLECVILSKPTNSLALYGQIVGRGVRRGNKEKFLFIDFCGNYGRFGPVEEHEILNFPGYGWGLFSGEKLLTGVALDYISVTRSDLGGGKWGGLVDCEVWFGKYAGHKVSDIFKKGDVGYLRYLFENVEPTSPDRVELKKSVSSYIKMLAVS